MKLPSINYQQRAPLARVDPMSYVRIGQAQAKASEAIAGVAMDVYNQASVSEMQSGELNYNEQLDMLEQDQSPYVDNEETGEREGAWVNGQKRFEEQEREIFQAAIDKMTTPLGKRLLKERRDKRINQRRKTNNGKLLAFQKDHNVATLQTSVDRNLQNKNFESAREAIAQAATVGTISERAAQSQTEKVFYEEKYYNFSLETDMVGTPKEAIAFREKVGGSSLTESDQNRTIKALDMNMINDNRLAMHTVIQDVEDSDGGTPAKAYAAGRKRLDNIMRTDSKKLGGDEDFKQRLYVANKIILEQYKVKVEKATTESKRLTRKNDYIKGFTSAAPDDNETAFSDTFLVNEMRYVPDGKTGYDNDYENPNPLERTVNKDEFLGNKLGIADKYVSYVEKGGHQVREIATLLNTSLTHMSGEDAELAGNLVYKIGEANPYALYADGKVNNMSIVYTQAKLAGGGEDSIQTAIRTVRKYNSLAPDVRKTLMGSKKDNDEYFEENFENVLEKVYPDSSWFSSAPDTKLSYKLMARRAMNTQLAINDGDQTKALNAVILTMSEAYAVSNTSGNKELMLHAPEKVVPDGEVDGGAWIREQGIAETKTDFPDMDTDSMRFVPVEKFDRQNPVYIKTIRQDGMEMNVGLIRFDRRETPAYKEQQKQHEVEQKAIKQIAQDNIDREKWEQDNPEHLRQRDHERRSNINRSGGDVNPYGKGAEQSNIGKAVMGQVKGRRGMAQAAAIAQKDIDALKAKRKKPKRQTRRGAR